MKKILFFISILLTGCSSHLTIMSYNIRNGKGMDQISNLKRTATVIKRANPDVALLQEVDSFTDRNEIDEAKELGNYTSMHSTFGSAINLNKGEYGVAILSKKRPVKTWKIALPGREERRTVLFAEFDKYIIGCTHLSLTKEDRIEALKIISAQIGSLNKPVFWGGDFNDTPESELIHQLSKTEMCLSDTTRHTFPADNPRITIDYIWTTKNNCPQVFKIRLHRTLNEPVASDHRPIIVKLKI